MSLMDAQARAIASKWSRGGGDPLEALCVPGDPVDVAGCWLRIGQCLWATHKDVERMEADTSDPYAPELVRSLADGALELLALGMYVSRLPAERADWARELV